MSAELASEERLGKVIAKFPQEPSGMTYEGTLLFERQGKASRVTVRFPERGTTGVRDTAVMMLWMSKQPEGADPFAGWMADPYDAARRDPLMRNVADGESHDAKFPEHPLSLVRAALKTIEESLQR